MRFPLKSSTKDLFEPNSSKQFSCITDEDLSQMMSIALNHKPIRPKYDIELRSTPLPVAIETEAETAESSLKWSATKIDTRHFESTKLKNGMRVAIFQTKVQPVVQTQIMYNFGSNDEVSSAERGLAHICEHMIFKGTKPNIHKLELSETDIPSIARVLGAKYNAFTTTNCTSYHFQSCPEYTSGFLRILASSMFDSRLDENHLRSEKLAVLAEMSHGKDSIFRDALIHMRQNMYGEHPRHPQYYPTIGNIKDIAELDATTLQTFYKRLYRPENATLFIVGDLSDEDVTRLKNTEIETLFEHNLSASPPISISNTIAGDAGDAEDEEAAAGDKYTSVRNFHTLSSGSAFKLVSFKMKGVREDKHSIRAFKALDTLLFDGEESRLHKSLITNSEFGVQSVGGFAQLDKDFGEYHIVVQGEECIKDHTDEIKASIHNELRVSIRPKEMDRCVNAVNFHNATDQINVESLVSSWIDDFKITEDLGNFWSMGDDGWKKSLVTRIEEIKSMLEPHAEQPVYTMTYTACTPVQCAERQRELSANRVKFTNLLNNEQHRRPSSSKLEPPNELNYFRSTFKNVTCPIPPLPCMTTEGNWQYVSDPEFKLVKAGIRPRQQYQMHQRGDNIRMALLADVISETFPQEKFMQMGVRGAFSPSLGVVTSYSAGKCAAFKEWVDTYASQITRDRQELIIRKFQERQNFFNAKWNTENRERRMDPNLHIADYLEQHCSDNYFVQENGFENVFDMYEKETNTFNVCQAIDTWNEYWGDTVQLVTQSEPSACDFEVLEPSKVNIVCPRTWKSTHTGCDTHMIQVNDDMELNQAIVTLARKASLNKSSLEYWSTQQIAQTILFSSLGSRLYKLREEKGLFYSAYGAFSVGASHKCNGYDMIQAKVDPGKEFEMVDVLRKWVKDRRIGFIKPIDTNDEEGELLMAKRITVNRWRTMNTESSLMSNWASHSDYFKSFVEAPNTVIDALQKVTVDDVNKYIETHSDDFSVSVVAK